MNAVIGTLRPISTGEPGAAAAGPGRHRGRRSASPVTVLAHRGRPGPGRPENSVAAAHAALAARADGLEIDVRLSADGVLVCSHDPEVAYESGRLLNVSTTSFAMLRRGTLDGVNRLASLDEVLTAAGSRGRTRVVVEAKPCPEPGLNRRVADTLRGVLAGFSNLLDLTVSSVDPALLRVVGSALTGLDVRTALLGSRFTPASELLRAAIHHNHQEIHPYLLSLLRAPGVIEAAHRLGIGVTSWTVNRPKHVAALAALGVDGLITDDPAAVLATLSSIAAAGHAAAVA